MEVGRLKSVLGTVIDDYQTESLLNQLSAIERAYSQSIQAPNQQTAEAYSAAIAAFREQLAGSGCVKLSLSRQRILQQLNASSLCGRGLVATIEAIDDADSPAEHLTRLQALRAQATKFVEAATALQAALDKLGFKEEDPPDGAAEIEIAVPQGLLDDGLAGFSKETKRLDRALLDVMEFATGARPPLLVSGLGTGSLEIFVTVDPVSGVAVLSLISGIITLINSVMQNRKIKAELEVQKAPKEVTESVAEWERNIVATGLALLTEDLVKRSPLDKPRKTELKKALADSIRFLAGRIDRGMEIDVSTAPTEEEEAEDHGAASEDANVRAAYQISKAAGSLATFQPSSEPTLRLPAPVEEPDSTQDAPGKTAKG